MKHPIKMIKMGLDQTFIRFLWLNDLVFMWIAKRKYKGYRKRIKRVPYEDEAFQEDMEDIDMTTNKNVTNERKEDQ